MEQIIKFDFSVEEIKSEVEKSIKQFDEEIDKILKIKSNERTFDNTVKDLSISKGNLYNKCNPIAFLSLIHVEKDIRDAATEAKKILEQKLIENSANFELFEALNEFKKENDLQNLKKEDKRVFEKLYEDMKRNGLNLTAEKRSKVAEIKLKICDLSLQFNKNVNEITTLVPFSLEDLQGMPSSFIEQLTKDEQGNYLVGLKYPHLFPILQFAQKWQTRKKLQFIFENRGIEKNVQLLKEILKLRDESAKLMEYESDSHFMLETKLAKTPEKVFSFLKETSNLLKPLLTEELQHLLQLKEKDMKERNEEFDGKINAWDVRFYQNLRLKTKFDVDDELARQYFPFSKVIEGVLSVYSEVLSLKFVKEEKIPVWHETVLCYSVYDEKKSTFFGRFYLDLFPRNGKYSHAACFPVFKRQEQLDGKIAFTVSTMVTNFTAPSASRPSLLQFSEVQTFFHEFGHVMHSLLSSSKYSRLNWDWNAVEQDFLEVPSMCFQNWVFNKEVLERSSSHFKTNEVLPSNLLKSLIDSAVANEGYRWRRLIGMSIFDLKIHSNEGHKLDLDKTWKECAKNYSNVEVQEGTHSYASFQHMTTGYNAGYYSYLYSEIIAKDLYSVFEDKGILSKKVGEELRNKILSPICIDEGNEMIFNFLGRESNQNAFLKALGVKL